MYDVTSYLDDHPGGSDSILQNAGVDCTDEFMAVHSQVWMGMEWGCRWGVGEGTWALVITHSVLPLHCLRRSLVLAYTRQHGLCLSFGAGLKQQMMSKVAAVQQSLGGCAQVVTPLLCCCLLY